jgi:O-antigen ligase
MTFAVPLFGLLVYAILTIWVQESWPWASFQAALFALAIGWTVYTLYRGRRIRGSLLLAPLAAALLLGSGQAALGQSVYRWGSWTSLLTWTTWGAVFFLSLQICGDGDARRWLLRAGASFAFVLSIVSTLQMYTSGGRIFWFFDSGFPDFVLGPFLNRNQYAAFIELLLPLALAGSLRDKRHRPAWCVACAVMFASLIAASSRAGVLLGSLEIVLAVAIALRGSISRKVVLQTAAALAAITLLLTLVVGLDGLRRRLDESDPFAGRREMNLSSLHMIQQRPWTGFGLGAWPIVYPRYALYDDGSFVNQAHNDWAQWAVEGGIPFAVLFLMLAIMAAPRAIDSIWGIGLLALLAHALVDYPFQQRPALGAWWFALLGALAARGRRPAERC